MQQLIFTYLKKTLAMSVRKDQISINGTVSINYASICLNRKDKSLDLLPNQSILHYFMAVIICVVRIQYLGPNMLAYSSKQ